ncbi:muts domain V-domain-containing protein [Podospora aff. communis PSN243]|uniref:Muts domain V-domain-containing protein n=1 Tax=Podospora aff. communis PSN243 TaxID=3040156 RepID=A0AAV9H1K6_9PEZI|nr:muts domain V-domain-containing protein [Podospora aff. communis PSN243]
MQFDQPRTPQPQGEKPSVVRTKAAEVLKKALERRLKAPRHVKKAPAKLISLVAQGLSSRGHRHPSLGQFPSRSGSDSSETSSPVIRPSSHAARTRSPYFLGSGSSDTSEDDFNGASNEPQASRDTARISEWEAELGSDSDWTDEDEGDALSTTQAPLSSKRSGQSASSSRPSQSAQQYETVCAISESRGGEVIGISTIFIAAQQVDVTRIINDDKYERLIGTLETLPVAPQCFLILKRVASGENKSLLFMNLKREYPDTPIIPYARKYWNEVEGLEMVDRFALCHEVKALRARLDNNFYVSCALAASMTYVQEQMNISFQRHSVRIRYLEPAGAMGLDRSTVESLELLQNARRTSHKNSTIFKMLDNTLTPQGRRLLRASLLQPSTDAKVITDRHDAIEDFTKNEDLFAEMIKRLRALLRIDAEKLAIWILNPTLKVREPLGRDIVVSGGRHQLLLPSHEDLVASESEMNKILMLKHYLSGVEEIHDALRSAEARSSLCLMVRHTCSPESLAPLWVAINGVIEPDATYSKSPIDSRNNSIWAVRAEPKSVLERARTTFRDRVNSLNRYVDGLNEVFTAKLGNPAELYLDKGQKYYLRFHWSDVEREVTRSTNMPQATTYSTSGTGPSMTIAGVNVVNGARHKQYFHCQTTELLQRSAEIQLQADLITTHNDMAVARLKESLQEHAEQLFRVSEAIAVLDMICSFVHISTTQNYTRPMMGLNTLVVTKGRHPVMEMRRVSFVANDVYSGSESSRFQVVTGGNMSGKSTFIKTIALIQILAQMGCFVPANFASMPICDRLFTRLSTDDKPESNLGTLAVELKEMNMILRHATKDSLVIIDELGRGTSPKEGLAYALAMSEMLIRAESRVYFATHFTKLARLLNRSSPSSVTNVHLTGHSTQEGSSRKIYLPHTIANGPVPNEDYGIDLARRFLPPRLIENAEKAHNSSMDNRALASFLTKLRTDYYQRLAEIETQFEEVDEVIENNPPAKGVPKPVLEKLSPEELKQVLEKGKRAEERVMGTNNKRRREKQIRPRADKHNMQANKKSKTVDRWLNSVPNRTAPFNRARMIEEQRQASLQRMSALQSSSHTVEKSSSGALTQPSNTSPDVFQPLEISSDPSPPVILPSLHPLSLSSPPLQASTPSLNASSVSAKRSKRAQESPRNDHGTPIIYCYTCAVN